MTISVMGAGVLRPIVAESVMVGGVLRKLKTVKVMRGGALVTVARYVVGELAASAAPLSVSGSRTGSVPRRVISEPCSITAAGGGGAYTYAWSVSGGVVADSPTSATTTFSATLFDDTVSAGASCTTTDNFGRTVTCAASVTLTHIYVVGGTS